jgi:mono/diheme cytochrome c family protein
MLNRIFLVALLLLAAVVARAEQPPGKRVFERHCAECHAEGFGHPGTQRLGWNRGEKYAVLERRKDLSAEYIKLIVRRGLLEMPPFRPSEITDADLNGLVDYLSAARRLRASSPSPKNSPD